MDANRFWNSLRSRNGSHLDKPLLIVLFGSVSLVLRSIGESLPRTYPSTRPATRIASLADSSSDFAANRLPPRGAAPRVQRASIPRADPAAGSRRPLGGSHRVAAGVQDAPRRSSRSVWIPGTGNTLVDTQHFRITSETEVNRPDLARFATVVESVPQLLREVSPPALVPSGGGQARHPSL